MRVDILYLLLKWEKLKCIYFIRNVYFLFLYSRILWNFIIFLWCKRCKRLVFLINNFFWLVFLFISFFKINCFLFFWYSFIILKFLFVIVFRILSDLKFDIGRFLYCFINCLWGFFFFYNLGSVGILNDMIVVNSFIMNYLYENIYVKSDINVLILIFLFVKCVLGYKGISYFVGLGKNCCLEIYINEY